MLFTDTAFLFYFLPLSLVLHRLTTVGLPPGAPYPNRSRLCFFLVTLVFYGWMEPWWLVPFAFCLSVDFFLARALHRENRPAVKKRWVTLSVIQNLAVLVVFKYWDFFLHNLAKITPLAAHLPRLTQNGGPIDLPPGISFYVFESLSFVIDVYRGQVVPPQSPLEFFAFIGMYPRFMAGPIVRYGEIQEQIRRYRGMEIEQGLYLFVIGLFLKCAFADSFAELAPAAFARWDHLSGLGAWVGVLAFTFQIYFDFSGYSLMAIGLGRCFGFRFPTNFNRPYLATSVQDFWRRWHMSLSRWLRDYLYIPLGGSRGGEWATYRNLMLTMFLGGLWHGASWVFAAWGLWHGLWLCLERKLGAERLPSPVRRAYTALAVVVGWVFFKASGIRHAFFLLRSLFWPEHLVAGFPRELVTTHPLSIALCLAGIAYCFWGESRFDELAWESMPTFSWQARGTAALLFLATAAYFLSSSDRIPFLYYQF
jgi:alginate O-acetyltransferase complex protein AlgI